jgi:hypothetical protein
MAIKNFNYRPVESTTLIVLYLRVMLGAYLSIKATQDGYSDVVS